MKIQDLHQQTSLTRIQPEAGFGDIGEGGIVQGIQGSDFSGDPSPGGIPWENPTTGQLDWVTLLGYFGDVTSPPQITADQNNYNPTSLATSGILRLDLDADHTLTGIAAPASGTRLFLALMNTSASALTLAYASASSAAANRILTTGDVDLVVPKDAVVSLVYDIVSSRWRVLAISSSSSGSGVPWFNLKSYGAVGNGSSDDTTAINAAIAALNTAGSGVLYGPAATYLTTGGLTTITAHALILGDGHGYADSHGGGGTEIRSSSGSNVLLTVTGTGSRFRDIGLRCVSAGTPTAGSGINAQADFIRYDNVAVTGFYDCVDHQNGGAWKMHGCWIVGAVRWGLRVRDTGSPDGGDQSIVSCWIYADQHNGSAAIRVESGGGLKISSCKINMFVSGHKWVHGIDVAPAATTTILIVSGNSIENYTGNGFNYSGSGWDQLIVVDNQYGQYGNSSGHGISIVGANDVQIGGGVFRADTGSPTAMVLNSGTRGLALPIVNHGFGTVLSTSSFTSLDDRTSAPTTSFGTPALTLATTNAAGSASTAIRTDATIATFDASAPTTSAVGDAAATGSAGVAARRDHLHGRESFGIPGNSAVGDVAAAGAAATPARSDHLHGREAFGSPVAVGTANADGVATTVPRSDHVHQGASGRDDHIHIVGEALTGDGATLSFLLANEAIPNTIGAYVAGLRTDVTLGGMNDQITFGSAPAGGAAIRVDYIPLQV